MVRPPRPPPSSRPAAPANRVRIVGGTHRGRLVRFPPRPGVRPTPDRVRETLFNWLGQDLEGRSTLEPFAGTGALSLEALSRGAHLAVAVDRDRALVDALRHTAAEWKAAGLEAHQADARAFLRRETRRFDVVFLDPPFADRPWDWLLPAAAAVLADDGVVYAECGAPLAPPQGWALLRAAAAGQVHYHLLAPDRPPC